MSLKFLKPLLVACLLAALTPFLMAQTGALAGKVTDASSAPVANAKVTAVSADTGQTQTATTGTDGVYRFALLPLGSYRVKVEAAGFAPVEFPSTTVPASGTANLDLKLEA